jgi:hypothetical protein
MSAIVRAGFLTCYVISIALPAWMAARGDRAPGLRSKLVDEILNGGTQEPEDREVERFTVIDGGKQ